MEFWPTSFVTVPPDRQRKDLGDIAELAKSIERLGQLQPIVVQPGEDPSYVVLVAGERRLRACELLGRDVQIVLFSSLDEQTRNIIELEENVKRKSLSWQEEADAVRKIHNLYMSTETDWSQERTGERLGMSQPLVSRYITVSVEVEKTPELAKSPGLNAASNVIARKRGRELTNTLEDLLVDTESKLGVSDPVVCDSFISWAGAYAGPRFNFIHCDFPYGVNMGTNALQDTRQDFVRYTDTKELYWQLVEALVSNIERLAAPECHIMFWFSMNYYTETVSALSSIGVVQPFPLIWVKSDNTGLLPDPQRGPRRIYETALLVSRGDRKIVKAVSNAFSFPANKDAAEHLSEKPVNVLLHFLGMLVDDTTSVLDPTAGSGTSLVAAKKLGAKLVSGVEIEQSFVDVANKKFWRET